MPIQTVEPRRGISARGRSTALLERKLDYPMMASDTIREHHAVVAAIAKHDTRESRRAIPHHMEMTVKRNSKDRKVGQ